jgi:hypothetical protein
MNRIPLLGAALLVALASLTACSAPANKLAALPTGVATAHGKFDEAAAYQFSWHIVGKSKYFDGSTDTCDLNLPISIEDKKALASSNTNLPVYGAVFRDGQIGYGTVWPTAVPGTGIVSGTGQYSISYDSEGLPVSATGIATVVWHDSKRTPSKSKRTDHILLTFTHQPRAGHC